MSQRLALVDRSFFLADRQEQPTLGARDSDEECRFVIDIGCYAHLRKLDGRLNGIDVSDQEAKKDLHNLTNTT